MGNTGLWLAQLGWYQRWSSWRRISFGRMGLGHCYERPHSSFGDPSWKCITFLHCVYFKSNDGWWCAVLLPTSNQWSTSKIFHYISQWLGHNFDYISFITPLPTTQAWLASGFVIMDVSPTWCLLAAGLFLDQYNILCQVPLAGSVHHNFFTN